MHLAGSPNTYAAGGQLGTFKMMQKTWKMTGNLANGYSSESILRELSNEYQHDSVQMVFQNVCVLVLWMKVASALEGLKGPPYCLTSLPKAKL